MNFLFLADIKNFDDLNDEAATDISMQIFPARLMVVRSLFMSFMLKSLASPSKVEKDRYRQNCCNKSLKYVS